MIGGGHLKYSPCKKKIRENLTRNIKDKKRGFTVVYKSYGHLYITKTVKTNSQQDLLLNSQ